MVPGTVGISCAVRTVASNVCFGGPVVRDLVLGFLYSLTVYTIDQRSRV